MKHLLLRLPLATAIAMATAHSYAATIVVDSNDDAAATTLCNLRSAITAMNDGSFANAPHCANAAADPFGTNDTINFAPALASATIVLTQGVLQLVGGPVVTINGSGQVLDAQNNSGVLSLINSTLTASNLTFTHGNAPAPGGGGIYTSGSTLMLDHCLIDSNTAAAGYAGAVYLFSGSVATLTNSTISNNTITCGGHCTAGAFASSSTLNLIASAVSGNRATGSSGTSSQISGGLYAYSGGTIALHDSTISGNSANGDIAITGGIYSWDATVFLINSTVAGNSATGNDLVAGGMEETHYSAAPNTADRIVLTNTTVSSNYANNPGGSATHIAGGIVLGTWNAAGTTSTMTLANTIVSSNVTTIGATVAKGDIATGVATDPLTTSASHSLLGAALAASYTGNGNQFSDAPRLAPLGNYGGGTQTMAPLSSSPAIDAGDNTLAVDESSNPLTTDQTGATRVVNATVDIGAVEYAGDEIFADSFGF